MNWINNLTWVEYGFTGFFLLMYVFYFIRVWLVSRRFASSSKSILVKFLMRSIYIGLLIAAVLGPTFGVVNSTSQASGKDLYLAIDLSNSMNASDVQPSRLERSKFEVLALINQLNDYRIGLLVFSSEAFMLTPLTFDKSALKLFIQQLTTNVLADNGTALSSVLNLTAEKYAADEGSNRFVRNVLIVTDGEDHSILPDSTTRKFSDLQINTFFWGVGTTQGSRISNGAGGYLKDNDGNEIITKLNVPQIRSNAKRLNGSYYLLNQQRNDINVLLKSISDVKNTRVDERKYMIDNNRYYYFLWIALALVILDVAFTVRVIKV